MCPAVQSTSCEQADERGALCIIVSECTVSLWHKDKILIYHSTLKRKGVVPMSVPSRKNNIILDFMAGQMFTLG